MGTEALLFEEWLNEDNENLKLLLFISKSSYDLVSEYSLKSIREWLGQKSSTSNKSNIKRLDKLQEKNYISYKREGNSCYISINADNKNQIKGIQTQWVDSIRNANRDKNYEKIDNDIKVDWTQTFRLFVNIHIGNIRGLTKQENICQILNVSRPIVSGALKLLNLCTFDDLKCGSRAETIYFDKGYEIRENEYIYYLKVGTNIDYLENAF